VKEVEEGRMCITRQIEEKEEIRLKDEVVKRKKGSTSSCDIYPSSSFTPSTQASLTSLLISLRFLFLCVL
jgi:hypothetical protein